MFDLGVACAAFVVLCASAVLGRWLATILPEAHRTAQTTEFIRLASGLLVTFTALVLGLLITTVNADFRGTDRDLRTYAAMIVVLDGDLAAYGPEAAPIRTLLRQYTAAVIASTWPGETPPTGDYPAAVPDGRDEDALALGAMMRAAETKIRRLAPTTPEAEKVQADSLARMTALLDQRWTLIGEAHSTITPAFFAMMMVWLVIVFVSFGLTSPGNVVTAVFIGLVGLSVACAIFVILELDGPLDGLIQVGSEPMRHALRHLDDPSALARP